MADLFMLPKQDPSSTTLADVLLLALSESLNLRMAAIEHDATGENPCPQPFLDTIHNEMKALRWAAEITGVDIDAHVAEMRAGASVSW